MRNIEFCFSVGSKSLTNKTVPVPAFLPSLLCRTPGQKDFPSPEVSGGLG